MKRVLPFFLTLLVFQLFAVNTLAAPNVKFSGLKKTDSGKLIFSEISAGTGKDGFALALEISEGANVKIQYEHNGSTKKILDRTYTKNTRIRIPDGEKFIYLKEGGTHNFSAFVTTKKNFSAEKNLLIQIKEKFHAANYLDVDFKNYEAATFNEYGNIENIKNLLHDIRPTELEAIKTRGTGSKLYKDLADSVVLIENKKSIGTGSVIKKDGTILTNWHVIKGSKTVKVVFRPPTFVPVKRSEKIVADVIKVNESYDLALIKLRRIPKSLKPIKFANKDVVEIAMDVHAIGHPKGNYWTYTKGVLSQVRPGFKWAGRDKIKHEADVLQTQTPINPGNSGGPLLADNSRMVGVNSFIDPKADGLNFAVAISTIKDFLNQKVKLVKAEKLSLNSSRKKTVRIDRDKDGYKELWVIDRNGNGVPDLFKIDKDRNGKADLIMFDTNENKVFELKISYVKKRGKIIAVYALDKNEDGKVDSYGFDFNLDGKIDKVQAA